MTNSLGALIIDLQGTVLTPDERDLLAHPLVGGVILFSRNYQSRAQLTALCAAIRSVRHHPLLIMVDQEGGRVQRFIKEFTRLPPMGLLGDLYGQDPEAALSLTKACGRMMALELLHAGVDMSLAPVLDLNRKLNTVIGDRAFHREPRIVISLASALMAGMREAGMAASGKHFPGHGAVSLDSHIAMPVDNRSLAEIEAEDLIPFAQLSRQGLPVVMAAHIVFSAVDSQPVGFSQVWLRDILRQKLHFSGAVVSDDLNMEGANISTDYADRVLAAREAGCDFALLCNQRAGVLRVIDQLPSAQHQVSEEKWRPLQGNFSKVKVSLEDDAGWLAAREQLSNLSRITTN